MGEGPPREDSSLKAPRCRFCAGCDDWRPDSREIRVLPFCPKPRTSPASWGPSSSARAPLDHSPGRAPPSPPSPLSRPNHSP
ncbi:rCG50702 [Rattus norvegicus]|uniref:RCG50702 n=1 Tax=Rattus norvegicus TaxID=10116 RepID=A6KCC8_RAT|nr:rCG50702 [Rattus norvegicus]